MHEYRVKVNRVELQVQEHPHDGEAIIFLHFSGANLRMWEHVIPYFRDRYCLILVDLRGHGRSDRPVSGYHMDELARDVVGIMDALQLERAHVVGTSLGAEVGLSLAANYPKRALSLVCDGALASESGPYGTWAGSEAEFEEHVARQLERMANRQETVYPSADALVDASREVLEKYGWWNEAVAAMERYGARRVGDGKYVKAPGKEAMLDYMAHYFRYRFEDYYQRVTCPLLMVAAEAEPGEERERAAMQGLCALAKRAEIVEVPGWEHPYGWLLDPAGVCRTILAMFSAN